MRELLEGVTYRQFAAMAKLMDWTAEDLGAEFRGITEGEPAAHYFARVLRGDPDWSVVIASRSIIGKYLRAAHHLFVDGRLRACACGCGSAVFGRDRLAWPECKGRPAAHAERLEAGAPIP